MASINTLDREPILNAMHALGILCIAPTHDEVLAYPQAEQVRSIQQFPDADPARFVVETNDNDHWTFGANQVKLVLSGHLKTTTSTIRNNKSSTSSLAAHPEIALVNALAHPGAYASRNTKVTPLLDFHIRLDDQPGSPLKIVRLIGPRTSIGIVGDNAPPSLLDTSKPIEMAQILMPEAQFDTEFHDFDPPSSIRRTSSQAGGMSGSLTIESWAFYSPWVGIIKQSMYGW